MTNKYHVLPRSICSIGQAHLDFEPTSSHFHVIEFVEVEGACVGEGSINLRSKSRSIFLNGFMHMVEYSVIVAMDMEGKTWRTVGAKTCQCA